MHVSDIMTTDVVTIDGATPFKDAVRTLLDHDIAALPVVDPAGALIGIVTEADLLAHAAYGAGETRPLHLLADFFSGRDPAWEKRAAGTVASDYMSPRVMTIRSYEPVAAAARRMIEHGVKHLVVVDDHDRVEGIVARGDILGVFAPSDAAVAVQLRGLFGDEWRIPEGVSIELFTVDKGVVTLVGTVRQALDIPVVEGAVLGVPGVVGVSSDLRVVERQSRTP